MDLPDFQTLLGLLFHYPDKLSKTKEYADLRKQVTLQYGQIMAWVLVAVLAFIPLHNYLVAKGRWFFSRVHILRSVNSALARGGSPSAFSSGLQRSIYALYLNLSTIGQISLWTVVFLVLGLSQLHGSDLIFLAKRLGRLCAVALPAVFFLTLRPSPLPHTLYLTILPMHKWLSRAVVLSAVVHTALYCGYFDKNGTWDKAWKPENLTGWAAVVGFVLIAVSSVSTARDRSYKTFFINHYFWSWVIVLALPFHIRPVNTYVANTLNIGLLLWQAAIRIYMTRVSRKNDLKVYDVSPNLACVEFPNSLLQIPASNPGAHVRVTNYHPNIIMRLFKQLIPNYHPYTLVSLPLDRMQRLIVRKSAFQWESARRYMVCGTFDPKLMLIKSRNTPQAKFSLSKLAVNARKILVVIGGSAISFAIPLVRTANYHGIPIKVIWVVRDFRDIAVLRYFDGYIHGDDFEIFVTGIPAALPPLENTTLQNAKSYGTFWSREDPLELTRYRPEEQTGNQELENVDVDIAEDGSLEEEDCPRDIDTINNTCLTIPFDFNDQPVMDSESDYDGEIDMTGAAPPLLAGLQTPKALLSKSPKTPSDAVFGESASDKAMGSLTPIGASSLQPQTPHTSESNFTPKTPQFSVNPFDETYSGKSLSRRTSRSHSVNEPFRPVLDLAEEAHRHYMRTIHKLQLERHVYKGRPLLNYRYYNWCANETDIFTQCSGPVRDDSDNLVCCRDLPGRQHTITCDKQLPDVQKVWVISAGPKLLVKKTKLWANENGLKYHEEAFYV